MPSCAQQPVEKNLHAHREKEDSKLSRTGFPLIMAIEYRVCEASRDLLFLQL